jgi:2-polyprenyl-6-methoxyphenol hydroxylase-like FAD-dependent oxidoreductase
MSQMISHPAGKAGRRQAVVIGGSMAGLFAARVLSDHFEQVTIIDRDSLPDHPSQRKGVPQAQHIHVLLARGMQMIEALLPGLPDDLENAGAARLEWAYDNLVYTLGVWLLRTHTGYFARMCSRELFEFKVRQRVQAIPNIRFLDRREAIGLLANEAKAAVIGVRTRTRGQAAGAGDEAILADWVVDASGRNSHTPEWLAELGYGAVVETSVNSFLGYASRLYARPANSTRDWQALIMRGRPPYEFRGGALYPIEGDRWIVTVSGAGPDYPPLDDSGFLEFAETLGKPPLLAEALREAQPLGPAVGYRSTDNRWHHYERLERWPDNFVVVGDAACAFNPVYGQGMTIAGLDAQTLGRCLREEDERGGDGRGLPHRFQRVLARELEAPWLLATGEDYRVPQTEGPKPSRTLRTMHAYVDRITVAASRHPKVFLPYFEVTHLLQPPAVLFRLGVIARALMP